MKDSFQKYYDRYPAELSLLLKILREGKHSGIAEAFKKNRINEEYLLKLISRHKVIGYLYKNLSPHLSSPARSVFSNNYKEHTRHTLNYVRRLILTSQKLDKHQIPYLAFKGPVLSEMLYHNPLVKDSLDLDIWVPLKYVEKFQQIIYDEGFIRIAPKARLTPKQKKKNYSISHHYTYLHKDERVVIELHWNITNPFSLFPLTFREAYKEYNTVTLNNHELRTLSHEHYLLYLAVHGSSHKWSRLHWLKDFSALLKASSKEQLNRAFQVAEKLKLSKPLIQALWISHKIFDTPIDESFVNTKQIKNSFFFNTPLKSIPKPTQKLKKEKIKTIFYRWQIRKNAAYRFSLLFRLRTHFKDWETLKLPDSLFFLYYPLRPFLFLYRLIFSRLKRN